VVRRRDEALELARELLDDIELSRLGGEALILKASRLARVADDAVALTWLSFERNGFDDSPESQAWIESTGRKAKDDKYWSDGLGGLEARISAARAQLAQLRVPDVQSDYVVLALRQSRQAIYDVGNAVSDLDAIRSRVVAQLHDFVARAYYELVFAQEQESFFDAVRQRIDVRLAAVSGDALERIEAIYDRLAAGDREATSQALNTCRRLIDRFADAMYPARDAIEADGRTIALGPQNTLNRIDQSVREHTDSESRRTRLRRATKDIYDRVCAGVHDDLTRDEARYLFLATYLLLGEVLSLEVDR